MKGFTPEWLKAHLARKGAKRKPRAGNAAARADAVEETHSPRHRVRIVSFRVRETDPDGLFVKFHIDGLRYAGLIPDDSSKHILLEVSQCRVAQRRDERTEITIEPI